MKKLFTAAFTILFMHAAFAGIDVHMLTPPDTVKMSSQNTVAHPIDFENNGLDDIEFVVYPSTGIYVNCINSQNFEMNVVNTYEGIAYNCGATMTATTTWDEDGAALAGDDLGGDYQFDNKGPRYLAFRKHKYTNFGIKYYQYGWFKIECAGGIL